MIYKYYQSPLGERLKRERRALKARMVSFAFLTLAVSILVFVAAGVKPAGSYQDEQSSKTTSQAGR